MTRGAIFGVLAIALLVAAYYLLRAGDASQPPPGPDAGVPAHEPPAKPAAPALTVTPQDPPHGPYNEDALPPAATDDAARPGSSLARAQAAYDRQDYDEAMAIARDALAESPGDVAMLGVAVATACARGDGTVAQQYYGQLPRDARADLKTRCNRFGIALAD